jgi:hypothetical protein
MAKLEAVLDANITPFERALKKASEKAREFGEGMGGVGESVVKGFSGLDLGKLMGIGAATYAAEKFGEALVDAAKEGYRAFEQYQEAVLRFKYTIPLGAAGGAGAEERAVEAVETARSKAGIFSAEAMENASQYLMQASKELRESPEKLNEMLDTLKAFAIKTSTTPEQIAESYRRLVVGIKEEGSPAVGKFFKATPGLEEETEKLRDAHAQAYLHAQGLSDASEASTQQLAQYHRLQREPISEFMTEESKRKGATAVLEEIKGILERSAPKAIIAEAEAQQPFKMLAKAWEKIAEAVGAFIKPKIDEVVRMLTDALTAATPVIKETLERLSAVMEFYHGTVVAVAERLGQFGTALFDLINVGGILTNTFQALITPVQALGKALWDKFNDVMGNTALAQAKAVSKHVDEVIEEKTREKEAREAPEKSAKEALTADTGIFSKERQKGEEEAAKIAAKADAAHAESARRISFEAAQEQLRTQAQIAARRAVIDRPRAMTEDLDKRYAIEADSAAKIINIKADAAIKANAVDQEAANRIARIDEEATARNIERETASAMDEGAERNAALAKLNAEDAAAALAREDAIAESREKIREADLDAANKIIDAQEEAAVKILDQQEAASLRALERMKGPYEAKIEEEPARFPTFGKWIKGEYHESEFERKEREKRNAGQMAEAEEKNRQWKEMQAMGVKHEFAEKKRVVEDELERQRPTTIGLKETHQIQQQEHVKAIEAEKGRTEADKDFAKAHAELALPIEPGKEPTGKADVSRKVLAELLVKMFDQEKDWKKDWDKVFAEA